MMSDIYVGYIHRWLRAGPTDETWWCEILGLRPDDVSVSLRFHLHSRAGGETPWITAAQLAEWDRLGRAATPGPWHHGETDGQEAITASDSYGLLAMEPTASSAASGSWSIYGGDDAVADFAFIAAAREAVPALIAEIRRLRGEA